MSEPSRSGAVVPLLPGHASRRAFHAVSAEAVAQYWWSDLEQGLAASEADERLERLGPNQLSWPAGLPALRARVVRDGSLREVPAAQLVPGDLVELQAGDEVPADVRLLRASELALDERALAGEASAAKRAHEQLDTGVPATTRSTMAFLGTRVAQGSGRGVVSNTGMYTELGQQLAPLLQHPEDRRRPLVARLVLGGLALVALVLAPLLGRPDAAAWAALGLGLVLPLALISTHQASLRRVLERSARPLRVKALPRLAAQLAKGRTASWLVIAAASLVLVALSSWGTWRATVGPLRPPAATR